MDGYVGLWGFILALANVEIWNYFGNSFAAWELGMGFLSMGLPESPLLRLSVIGWCMAILIQHLLPLGTALTFTALGSWGGGGWRMNLGFPHHYAVDVLEYIGSSPPFTD